MGVSVRVLDGERTKCPRGKSVPVECSDPRVPVRARCTVLSRREPLGLMQTGITPIVPRQAALRACGRSSAYPRKPV